ncbi:helix-turn-helix domain-containing protein [Streptomyces sp. NPDC006784]|uniref:helix-turn-helix domain-containing protein n=1 Tax=Streptomyces sp. NPDC006784 TaxID=3364764 RepID=UPI0036CAA2AB
MSVTDLGAKTQAALLLARGATTDKAGEAVGVSGRTVRRWREDPDFEAEVQQARRAVLNEAVAALGAAARDAVATLHAALDEDNASVRVRAASVLLSSLPAFAEHADFADRLAALEAAVAKAEQEAAA